MNYKLAEQFKNLCWSLAISCLFSSFLYEKGHPTAAFILATVLTLFAVILILFEHKLMNIDLPEASLGTDFMVIVAAIVVCLEESLPFGILIMMTLGFVGAMLDIVRLAGMGAFKNKTFKEIFDEQLRFPIELDLVLLFWPIYEGFKVGWNKLDTFAYVCIGLLVLDLIHNLIILPGNYRKEKQIINEYLQQLKNEKETLVRVDAETADLDEETKKLVIDRINLIDHILIGKMAGNTLSNRKANKEIEKVIADRASFIESLALQYSVSHPQAIDHLQQSGLSRYEIGLCCLYHMGYNGKEVKDISDTSMVYHVNSAIRQKLGLKSNDINLTTFIRELFSAD